MNAPLFPIWSLQDKTKIKNLLRNGSSFTSSNRSHMGTRRQKESGPTARDLEENSRKGALGERIKSSGRGGMNSKEQDSLYAEGTA